MTTTTSNDVHTCSLEPAHVPDNLEIVFTEDDQKTAEVVRDSMAGGHQLVMVECCTGQTSPNPAKLLRGRSGMPKWTKVDEDGFFVAGDEEGTLSKRLKSLERKLQPGNWCLPEWTEIGNQSPWVLSIDHHGDRSDEPCALQQAYHHHFGCLYGASKPRLLLSRGIDEDLASTACATVGALPQPFFFEAHYPEMTDEARDIVSRPFSDVVDIVEMVDLDPNQAPKLLNTWQGRELLVWREGIDNRFRDAWSAISAIDSFRRIFISRRNKQREWDAVRSRLTRIESIASVPKEVLGDGKVVVANLTGYDANSAFYDELNREYPFAVVLLGNFFSGTGRITFVSRSVETAVEALGEGGLQNFFAKIPGAGGRSNIGGASWSGLYNFDEDAVAYGKMLADMLD